MSNSIALITLAIAALSGLPRPPAPDFDGVALAASVMVAKSEPGESYARPKECMQENVICLRHPLWFRARPIQPVYGAPPKQQIDVTTYTHYGQPEPDDVEAPRILLLLESNGRFLMPAYASARVWRRVDGRYYLLIESPDPISWLPCSVDYLREPVDAKRFPAKAHLALDEYLFKQYPELFVRHKRYATHKFGISVTRLSEHLKTQQLSSKDFNCASDDES